MVARRALLRQDALILRQKRKTLTAHEARMVAVKAAADPRTVKAFLEGRSVRSTCRVRIEAALVELGFGI